MQRTTGSGGSGTRIVLANDSRATIYLTACSPWIERQVELSWHNAGGSSCIPVWTPLHPGETRSRDLSQQFSDGLYRPAAGYRLAPDGENRYVHGEVVTW